MIGKQDCLFVTYYKIEDKGYIHSKRGKVYLQYQLFYMNNMFTSIIGIFVSSFNRNKTNIEID